MDRLTARDDHNTPYYPYCNNVKGCGGYCARCNYETESMEKLAIYEDLEEQGLLLRLPCKVGDTIYELYRDGEYCVSWWDVKEVGFSLSYYERYKDKFGKSVFLTKEEAEQKLKELSK